MTRPLPVALAALALAACGGVEHVGKYVPKQREYAVPDAAQTEQASTPGSLWRDGRNTSLLFTDARALRENDLVVVKVEEIADAKRSSDTDLSRSSSTAAAVSAFLNAAAAIPAVKLDASTETALKALGSTARTEKLTATVPSLVRKVLPNGNLFIEGHRVVLVNSEEQHFYISGLVRPIDIDGDNQVSSTKVADAEIEFTGRGILTDNGRQGFAQKFWSWIWPF
ncbi:MAG: flagellar basal body L-ring protein FlgH [Anaeromyxobacter sp.]